MGALHFFLHFKVGWNVEIEYDLLQSPMWITFEVGNKTYELVAYKTRHDK